ACAQMFLIGGDVEPNVITALENTDGIKQRPIELAIVEQPIMVKNNGGAVIAERRQPAFQGLHDRHFAHRDLLDENVEDKFLGEALRIDAHVDQQVLIPAAAQFGAGVNSVDQHAVDIK